MFQDKWYFNIMHQFSLIFWHKDIFSQTSLKWVFMARIWHTHYCSKHSKDPVIVLLLNLEEMNLNLSVQCSQQSRLTKTSQHMYWHKDKHKKKITIIAQKKSQHKYTPIAY